MINTNNFEGYNSTVQPTLSRFLGLIQTDGNISFIKRPDRDGFTLRITLTAGFHRYTWLSEYWLPALQSWGLCPTISPSTQEKALKAMENRENSKKINKEKDKDGEEKKTNKEESTTIGSNSANLTLEGTVEIKKFLELVEAKSVIIKGIEKEGFLLVGEKLRDFLLMKEMIKLNERIKTPETDKQKEFLIKIGEELIKVSTESRQKGGKKELETSFSFEENKSKEIWQNCVKKYKEQSKNLIDKLKLIDLLSENTNEAFQIGEFVAGTVEGDGSIQIVFQPESRTQKTKKYSLTTRLTITNIAGDEDIFELVGACFGSTSTRSTPSDNSSRATFAKKQDIHSKIVPLLEKHNFTIVKYSERLKFFAEASNLSAENVFTTDCQRSVEFGERVFKSPLFGMQSRADEYIAYMKTATYTPKKDINK